jgi:hypothetical protein
MTHRDITREENIRRLFASGKTLQEIGDFYGLTRERIRQILARSGITRTDGGAFVKAMARKAESEKAMTADRDARCFRGFGCSYAEVLALNGGSRPWSKGSTSQLYGTQRNTAKVRGIGWNITFPEWMAVWKTSGHLDERGRGKYVMARLGDTGPYAVGNVHICTSSENIKEGYVFRKFRRRKADAQPSPMFTN